MLGKLRLPYGRGGTFCLTLLPFPTAVSKLDIAFSTAADCESKLDQAG